MSQGTSCSLQYVAGGSAALAATYLLGGLAAGAVAGALLANRGRGGRGYGGYRYGRRKVQLASSVEYQSRLISDIFKCVLK